MSATPSVVDFTKHPNLGASLQWASGRPDGAGFTELLRATDAGRIALVAVLNRRAVWTPRDLKSSLPTIVLIGDDAGDSRDPSEWRSAISAIAWARCAIVHGTGAQQWHYLEAIAGAEMKRRCLFIETNSAHVGAWMAALAPRQIQVLSIIPPGGQTHPILARERAA